MQLKKLGQSGEPNKSVRRSGVKAGVSLLPGQEGGGGEEEEEEER